MKLSPLKRWLSPPAPGAPAPAPMPTRPSSDDLYLVAFPKSGVTWLSVLMANANLRLSGIKGRATYWNIPDFVHDIHISVDLPERRLPVPGYRLIKSHAPFHDGYKKVIYLVRDPRDIMVSYFHFLRGLREFEGSVSQLIASPDQGVASWVRHVSSWVSRVPLSHSFNLIRYEDLKSDPAPVLTRLYALQGFFPDPELIAAAVADSTFPVMKADEEYYNLGHPRLSEYEFSFMRKGEKESYKKELDRADIAAIESSAGEWMARLGYPTAAAGGGAPSPKTP